MITNSVLLRSQLKYMTSCIYYSFHGNNLVSEGVYCVFQLTCFLPTALFMHNLCLYSYWFLLIIIMVCFLSQVQPHYFHTGATAIKVVWLNLFNIQKCFGFRRNFIYERSNSKRWSPNVIKLRLYRSYQCIGPVSSMFGYHQIDFTQNSCQYAKILLISELQCVYLLH